MEDKHRHIDNQAFADHAWAEMRKLLDEEMPMEGKRKKRFVWWWALLALGLLGGAAAYGWISQKSEPVGKTKHTPIAVLEEENGADNTSVSESISKDKIEKEKPEPSFPKIEKAEEGQSKANISKVEKIPQTSDYQSFRTKESTLPLAVSTLAKMEVETSDVPVTNKIEALSENTNEAHELPEPMLVDRVPELAMGEFDSSEKQPSLHAETPTISKMGWSAYTSISRHPSQAYGIGAGLLADMPIRNSRFNVQVGLGYAYVSQPLDYILVRSPDDSTPNGNGADLDTTGNNMDITYEDAYAVFDVSNPSLASFNQESNRRVFASSENRLAMHFIQVPVDVSYRRGRWRGLVGTEIGVLLTSKSDYTSGGIFSNTGKNDEDAIFAPGLNSADASPSVSKVTNFDFATTAGIGFDFSQKIGLDLKYRMGMVDIIKDNDGNKDRNRFFSATLRYRIK